MKYAKLTGTNKTNTPALLSTVITPQNEEEKTKQAYIQSTLIIKPLNLPSASQRMTPVTSQHLISRTKRDMTTSDINSELPSSEDDHIQVSTSTNNDSQKSSKRPSTTPTSDVQHLQSVTNFS
eukprot:9712416-Ditylum_brightwellii.AAC.1